MKSSRRTNIYFIYFICFIIVVVKCHSILPKGTPEIVDTKKVLHIGDIVQLKCSTTPSISSRWSHLPNGNKHRIKISTGDQLSPEYAGNERFRLDTSTGKYDLLINNLNKQDAGVYFCTTQEKEYSIRLVIEKKQRYLKETPTSVTVVKGQDVRLNCATSYPHPVYWIHIPVGKRAMDVFVVGVLSSSYATSGRYNVEVNSSIGQYDLVIRQVQLEDAGTFVCIDDYGAGLQVSADVTVLDASPVCQSNASDDGVLIENDCGLPPDLLHITCRTKFAGSAEPQLLLKHSGVTYDAIAKETKKSDPNGQLQLVTVISRYILQPDLRMTTEELSCELTGLHRLPFTIACDIHKFKIQYIFNSTTISITKVLSPHKVEDTVTCSSNSSEQCSYKWNELQNPEEVLSITNSASFGPGTYVCIAECNIRGKICIFASLPFDGVQRLGLEDHDGNPSYTTLVIILSFVCLIILGTFVILVVYKRNWVSENIKMWSKKNRQELEPWIPEDGTNKEPVHVEKITEEKQTDTADERIYIRNITLLGQLQVRDSPVERSHTINNKTDSGEGRNEVRGLALLGGMVYVVRQTEKNIQAYDTDSGLFIRDIDVPALSKKVRDMASCVNCKCLYVADEDNNKIHKIQLRSWEQKEDIITQWSVPGVPESLYSKECHLIVSIIDPKQILRLNKNGDQVLSIQLRQHPWHAIPVKEDMYAFSYTSSTSAGKEDKVCLIDKDGNIQATFEGDASKRLNKPGRMVVTKSGLVFIADYNNDRVVLLNSKLEPIDENIKSVKNPSRICFDEDRQRLFIAAEDEKFNVFVFQACI